MKDTTPDRRGAQSTVTFSRGGKTSNTPTRDDLIDSYVAGRIDYRVREMAFRLNQSKEQQEDMRQDIILELLKAAERHKPDVSSWHTMAGRVIDLYSRHLSRQKRLQQVRESGKPLKYFSRCRDDREAYAPNELGDDFADASITRMDTEDILSKMPPRLQELCNHLKRLSPPEAAQKMGIHPNSIYRLIREAKQHFLRAGYDYSKKARGNSASTADIAFREMKGNC